MKALLLASCLVLVPAVTVAQEIITSYEFRVYAAGAVAPTSSTPFPASAATCNQAAPSVGTTVNPTTVLWDDPSATGRVCSLSLTAGTGPIVTLPSGTYTGSIVAANTEGASPESNRAPFSRARVPAARTGVRF